MEAAFPLLSDFQPMAPLLSLHEPGSFRQVGSSKNRHQMWLNKDSGAGRSFNDRIIGAFDSMALELCSPMEPLRRRALRSRRTMSAAAKAELALRRQDFGF